MYGILEKRIWKQTWIHGKGKDHGGWGAIEGGPAVGTFAPLEVHVLQPHFPPLGWGQQAVISRQLGNHLLALVLKHDPGAGLVARPSPAA